MPRTGERLTSELTWQEELGIEPVGGYPEVAKMTEDQILTGLVGYVENRNSTTGYDGKMWVLYRDEFFRRISNEELGEAMAVSVVRKILKLSDFVKEIRELVNKKI